jgi:hypothetical protein
VIKKNNAQKGFTADVREFTTDIDVNSVGPYFKVKALNSSGQVIGTSQIVHVEQEKE